MNMRLFVVLIAVSIAAIAPGAHAGRSCEERPVAAEKVQHALEVAHQVRQRLDDSGAELVLIGRAGQDLSKWGLKYSHFGIAWRDHTKGRWLVVHELNQCGTDRADLFDEGLGNFFLDDLWKIEAVVLVPGAATQQRLAQVLKDGRHLDFLERHYSMVAYPFSTRYQNSNQWALEVIAASLARPLSISSRGQAQEYLQRAGYEPTELTLGTLTRLGARVTRANIAFDDHPGELRWSNRIRTVTVESVFKFVERIDPEARRFEVR
jgi:hypothetical protein